MNAEEIALETKKLLDATVGRILDKIEDMPYPLFLGSFILLSGITIITVICLSPILIYYFEWRGKYAE